MYAIKFARVSRLKILYNYYMVQKIKTLITCLNNHLKKLKSKLVMIK